MASISRHGRADVGRPLLDATGKTANIVEPGLSESHGDREAAHAVMAVHNDRAFLVNTELSKSSFKF